ncbi:hypothetical protein [Rhodococcus sp. 1168]|uniref:hypothetical protein n=1 Tax=Rhodococcus sp. 1168 TaxID=2018041 RepID=UPI000A0BA5D8|nr:hypothetical protein [Rhodococcus sp. 1168]ORI27127.1 hypothetical protein BJI47_08570 [Rhodococcus sp. 1168]
MRFTLIPVVAFAALVALVGCSSSDSADGSVLGANADVCTKFSAAHDELAALATTGPGVGGDTVRWTADKDAALAKISPLADQAEGQVKANIQKLVSALPKDSLELTEADSVSGQAFVDNSEAVATSCDSSGTTVELAEFPLQKF